MNYEPLHLDSDEHVILEVRKHWIVFAGHAISMLFLAFLPFIGYSLVRQFLPELLKFEITGNSSALFTFLYSLWLIFIWISFFVDWTKYYLDVWYVTEKRIIDVEQKRIFDRQISNLRFDRIQDVTIDVHGFLPTILNFGNVRVQTAAEDSGDFSMSTVRDPEQVRRVIFGQHNTTVSSLNSPEN